jgi:uncharacterized protein
MNNKNFYIWLSQKPPVDSGGDCPAACVLEGNLSHSTLNIYNVFHSENILIQKNEYHYIYWSRNFNSGVFVTNSRLDKIRSNVSEKSSFKLLSTLPVPNNNKITAWIQITDICNLNCSYCFVPKSKNKMNILKGKTIIDSILESAKCNNVSRVHLKYSGGEALSNKNLFFELHQYAIQQSVLYNIELTSVLLSNGYLIDNEIISKLKSLDTKIMISIDSILQNNKFEHKSLNSLLMSNSNILFELKNSGLLSDISITLTQQNIKELPTLVEYFLINDLPFSLNFYRPYDNSTDFLILNEDIAVEYLKKTYKIIEKYLPNRNYLSTLLDRVNLSFPHNYTCDAGISYINFDTEGHIFKCQMDIGNKSPISKINSDVLSTIINDKSTFSNTNIDEIDKCSNCEIKYFCTGGCPNDIYSIKISNLYCGIYKKLYRDILILEGLRILKYEQPEILN